MFLRANCNFVTVYTKKGIQTDWVLNDLTDINKIELMQRQCLVVFIYLFSTHGSQEWCQTSLFNGEDLLHC